MKKKYEESYEQLLRLKETHWSKTMFQTKLIFILKDRSNHVDFKMYIKDRVTGLINYTLPII